MRTFQNTFPLKKIICDLGAFTFDPAAKDSKEGEQLYNLSEIVAERVAISKCPCDSCARDKGKQVSQWRVNWEGFASEHDSPALF